ncbi:MAG TPA: hypothetical protein VFE25_10655 [Opitutaceae bacterium]|jgi:hypothetical protein|nr:hypothetical protein [Opitutaceae bacterium]
MNINQISLLLAVIGTACWIACFWWMYRISENQNRLLDRLTEQGKRIERWSKIEHDLIKEVHPQVGEIKESMGEMMAAVKENTEANTPPAAKPRRA